jgi:hypothetical protein
VEPDPVVGNPADQPDMREAEPWHHALLGEQNGGSGAASEPAVSYGALVELRLTWC